MHEPSRPGWTDSQGRALEPYDLVRDPGGREDFVLELRDEGWVRLGGQVRRRRYPSEYLTHVRRSDLE